MYSDAKRIHLLEKLLKEQDDKVLRQVEELLSDEDDSARNSFSPISFGKHTAPDLASIFGEPTPDANGKYRDLSGVAGTLTPEEAESLQRSIDEAFGNVDESQIKTPFE